MNNDSSAQLQDERDVYSRLYDKNNYTGVYRKRFDMSTHDLSETVVHDLSETTRNHKRNSEKLARKSGSSQTCSQVLDSGFGLNKGEDCGTTCEITSKNYIDPNDPHTLLKGIFHYYCRFGRTAAKGADAKTLDNANFSKLCRECPDLLDAKLTRTEIDLIFVKVKKKKERRISYARFLDAIGMIAQEKYPELPLEQSVPKMVEMHIANLPCIPEITHGKIVQAIWVKKNEKQLTEGITSLPQPPMEQRSSSTCPPVPLSTG